MAAGGLFTHRGQEGWPMAQRREHSRLQVIAYAQALADSPTGRLSDAARAIGVTQQRGSVIFKRICAELGEQAI